MDNQTLTKMLRHCRSDETVASFHRVTYTLANDTYMVETESENKYAIKVFRTQLKETVAVDVAIQKALKNTSITTPDYLEHADGEFFGEEDGAVFTISEFIPGEYPSGDVFTHGLVVDMGATLAIFHDAMDVAAVTVQPNAVQWLSLENALDEIQRAPGYDRLDSELRRDYQQLEGLPKAITHACLARRNLFAKDNKVTAVFDFETAENTYRILDIVFAYIDLINITTLTHQELKSALVEGYNREAKQPITDEELRRWRQAVSYTTIATAAWFRNNNAPDRAQRYMNNAGIVF